MKCSACHAEIVSVTVQSLCTQTAAVNQKGEISGYQGVDDVGETVNVFCYGCDATLELSKKMALQGDDRLTGKTTGTKCVITPRSRDVYDEFIKEYKKDLPKRLKEELKQWQLARKL